MKNFTNNISHSIFVALLQEEKSEGVHSRLLSILKELPVWTKFADLETAKLLVNSKFAAANEAGGIVLQARAEDWKNEFSTEEIVEFSNHEILSIRQTSWQLAEKLPEKCARKFPIWFALWTQNGSIHANFGASIFAKILPRRN